MLIRWYGQSAFLLTGREGRVFIDPFGDMAGLATRGIAWEYPPIRGVKADVVLVTHGHRDHDAVHVVGGEPTVVRDPGRHESAIGEVVGVASEHDDAAGTERGANTIFRFVLDGLTVAHLGDLGQPALRPAQRAALAGIDVLFVPVGGGPTIGGAEAAAVVRGLQPRLVVPMHYRTERIGFLEPPDSFLGALGARVEALPGSEARAEALLGEPGAPAVALLRPP